MSGITIDKDLGDAITIADSPSVDAFSRLRISNPNVEFDAIHAFGEKAFLFDTDTATGGTVTYNSNQAAVDLAVTNSNGSKAVRQSKRYIQYTPGQSQLIFMTAVMAAAQTNLRQRIGFFDEDDGWFFELNDSTLSVVQRSSTSGSPVDTAISQANWNIDTLDGSGDENNPSGILLDITKSQIFVIDFQWLGVGRSRMAFDIDGVIVPVHEFLHANITTGVYLRQPAKPVRSEIEQTGSPNGAATLRTICASVISEGDVKKPAINRAKVRVDGERVNTTFQPILSIRLKSAFNRAEIIPHYFEVMVQTADDVFYELRLNASLTGPSWTSVDSDSIAEFDEDASSGSGGTVIKAGTISNRFRGGGLDTDNLQRIASDIAGTSDTLSIFARSRSGNATVFGALEWCEVF